MNKIKVLFLCTGNSARSQMAEAFLRHYAGSVYESYSAGLSPSVINPFTIQVMQEAGIDISDQYSKSVKIYLGKMNFGYLITVCDQADRNCPTIFPGISYREHWSFEDPAAFEGPDEEKIQKFREIRDQINQKIQTWLADHNKQ